MLQWTSADSRTQGSYWSSGTSTSYEVDTETISRGSSQILSVFPAKDVVETYLIRVGGNRSIKGKLRGCPNLCLVIPRRHLSAGLETGEKPWGEVEWQVDWFRPVDIFIIIAALSSVCNKKCQAADPSHRMPVLRLNEGGEEAQRLTSRLQAELVLLGNRSRRYADSH